MPLASDSDDDGIELTRSRGRTQQPQRILPERRRAAPEGSKSKQVAALEALRNARARGSVYRANVEASETDMYVEVNEAEYAMERARLRGFVEHDDATGGYCESSEEEEDYDDYEGEDGGAATSSSSRRKRKEAERKGLL